MTDPVATFYDNLALDYHRIFEDWDRAIEYQGAVLARLLEADGIVPPMRIHDAACGIGTQALALAKQGYQVVAADLSAAAVAEADKAARDRSLNLHFEVADLRVQDPEHRAAFDAVIAFDNAVAHLAPGAELDRAMAAMADKLRPGGLLALSLRDYDALVEDRPTIETPRLTERPDGRSITVQLWDWLRDGSGYDLRHFVLVEETGEWRLSQQTTRLYALRSTTLEQSARTAGLTDVQWLLPAESGYYQPVQLARRGE